MQFNRRQFSSRLRDDLNSTCRLDSFASTDDAHPESASHSTCNLPDNEPCSATRQSDRSFAYWLHSGKDDSLLDFRITRTKRITHHSQPSYSRPTTHEGVTCTASDQSQATHSHSALCTLPSLTCPNNRLSIHMRRRLLTQQKRFKRHQRRCFSASFRPHSSHEPEPGHPVDCICSHLTRTGCQRYTRLSHSWIN